MDNDKNDYDRISEQLDTIITIVWSTQCVLEDKNINVAKNLCAPALTEATRKLNQLDGWVQGLAKSHRV